MSVEITNDSKCHAELVSASHREPFLVLLRGQILKRVQDDHQLCSVVLCYIEEQKKQFFRQWAMSNEPWECRDVCVQRPKFLLLLLRICYSLFLRIRVCDPTIENMSFCSSVQSKISQLIAHRSPLNVKHFYFCPQVSHWCQNEQKPLKIVQKQT